MNSLVDECLFTGRTALTNDRVLLPTKMAAGQLTAGIIVIGDEILKGLVQDTNSSFLCKRLWELGIKVERISTIPDTIDVIAKEVQLFSSTYDFVFTSGGVGPTHDDVTMDGVAQAVGEELVHCTELEEAWSSEVTTTAAKHSLAKMLKLPRTARLEFGSDSNHLFPLIIVRNVHVYPGVPQYLQMIFELNKGLYQGSGHKFYRTMILLKADELDMAGTLRETQEKFTGLVSIGSYPVLNNTKFSLKVTVESTCKSDVDQACSHLRSLLEDKDSVVQVRLSRSHSLSSSSMDEEEVGRPSLKSILNDKASSCEEGLVHQLLATAATMEEVLRRYQPKEICLAFNGGKDCTVLLDLFSAVWSRNDALKDKRIKALYVASSNPFKEVEEFIQDSVSRYNLELIKISGEIRAALSRLKELDPSMKTILMGTRYTDPHSDTLSTFCPTDPSWPEYMRVLPLLEWSYSNVWSYLKLMQVPYCVLYDRGYTSLGSTFDTAPNPALRQSAPATKGKSGGVAPDHTHSNNARAYMPAFMLTDDTLERAGRN